MLIVSYSRLVTDMKSSNIKRTIEEKSIALEETIKLLEKEQKRLSFFKSQKKIEELEKKIASIDEEINGLNEAYNNQLESEEKAAAARKEIASKAIKYAPKVAIGCAVACVAYCGGLFFKPLDYHGEQTTFRAMIGSFENITVNADNYTPETYEQYMNNLQDAEAKKNDIFMSDEEKLAYLDSVSNAYKSLEPIPDKTALSAALNKAEKYDTSAYTPASVKDFKSVIKQVKSTYDDVNATKKEVTAAEKTIDGSYQQLTLKADKSELAELYDKYRVFELDEYTPASADNFKKEIKNAEKLIADDDASQSKVDLQVKAMESIESYLVLKADKTSLQSLIDECSQLNGDNYKSGYDELVSEVDSVKSILSNENASQEDVDSAVTRLQTAEDNLVEYTTYVYRVNMHASMESNNHVGNDWSYDRYCNGAYTHDGFEITGNPGSAVTVGMQITENDSWPEQGYGSTTIALEDGYESSFNVTVVENRGRYYGNAATFTVNVSVTFLRRE